eukprot:6887930-Lingulodinium_polyedra.AAC.1
MPRKVASRWERTWSRASSAQVSTRGCISSGCPTGRQTLGTLVAWPLFQHHAVPAEGLSRSESETTRAPSDQPRHV